MKGNIVDFDEILANYLSSVQMPMEHLVARSTAQVLVESLRQIGRTLDAELREDPRTAGLKGVSPARVFHICQYPDNGAEGVYMVQPAGQVIRVRVDAFGPEDAAAMLEKDPHTGAVLDYQRDVLQNFEESTRP